MGGKPACHGHRASLGDGQGEGKHGYVNVYNEEDMQEACHGVSFASVGQTVSVAGNAGGAGLPPDGCKEGKGLQRCASVIVPVQACFAMVRNRGPVRPRKGRGEVATAKRKYFD